MRIFRSSSPMTISAITATFALCLSTHCDAQWSSTSADQYITVKAPIYFDTRTDQAILARDNGSRVMGIVNGRPGSNFLDLVVTVDICGPIKGEVAMTSSEDLTKVAFYLAGGPLAFVKTFNVQLTETKQRLRGVAIADSCYPAKLDLPLTCKMTEELSELRSRRGGRDFDLSYIEALQCDFIINNHRTLSILGTPDHENPGQLRYEIFLLPVGG